MKIEIKNRWDDSVIFSHECDENSIAITVNEAIKSSADLRSANLRYADLSSANLSYADLRSANLSSADLSYADLSYADLSSADLSYADLSYADLSYADLSYADLSYADLSYADLSSANLRYADLSSANLRYADLSSIKNDLWDVLLKAIPEIPKLRDALISGKIDGSVYEGECCCLVGTLEKQPRFQSIYHDDLRDSSRPIERFFIGIKKGDTSETNQISAIVLGWINEFDEYIKTVLR